MTNNSLKDKIDNALFASVESVGVREGGTIVDLDTLIIDRQKAVDAIIQVFIESLPEKKHLGVDESIQEHPEVFLQRVGFNQAIDQVTSIVKGE